MKYSQIDTKTWPVMLSTQDLADLMQCSDRHIANLRKEGRMPAPVRLGTLVRWPRKAIEDWIAAGCPATGKVA